MEKLIISRRHLPNSRLDEVDETSFDGTVAFSKNLDKVERSYLPILLRTTVLHIGGRSDQDESRAYRSVHLVLTEDDDLPIVNHSERWPRRTDKQNIFFASSDKLTTMEQTNTAAKVLVNALYAFKAQNTDEVNRWYSLQGRGSEDRELTNHICLKSCFLSLSLNKSLPFLGEEILNNRPWKT